MDIPEPLDERALTIFVDGSMRPSPRRGGIGIRFVWINEYGQESEAWDHALPATDGATNQQMELEAPYRALKLAIASHAPFDISAFDKIEIRTDSEYVKDGVGWAISYWSKNGWTTRDGGAVLNVRDWKSLLSLMRRLRTEYGLKVNFEWKKGKKGKHAIAVDQLAKQSSKSFSMGRSRPNVVRRKKSPESVEPGSVRMEGQVIAIRIIQAQYLPPPHRRSRYKYEVVDESSQFFRKVDWAESELSLKRGHTYSVRMNVLRASPRIEELLDEVEEDLTPFLDALDRIGRPATAREVHEGLKASRFSGSADAVRRRLDRLVDEEERVARTRGPGPGRPYVYEVAEGDAE